MRKKKKKPSKSASMSFNSAEAMVDGYPCCKVCRLWSAVHVCLVLLPAQGLFVGSGALEASSSPVSVHLVLLPTRGVFVGSSALAAGSCPVSISVAHFCLGDVGQLSNLSMLLHLDIQSAMVATFES